MTLSQETIDRIKIDAIIKQANFFNEEVKWSRITQPPSAPTVEETKNEIWRNSILNLQGREKEFYDMLRYCLNDEELALGYCSSFESIAKKYDTSATQGAESIINAIKQLQQHILDIAEKEQEEIEKCVHHQRIGDLYTAILVISNYPDFSNESTT